MSEASAWMPLYVGDYLADTMHLNGAEHGAYLLLIMHYWRNGPLRDDDKILAAIARTDRADWTEIGPTVRAFFSRRMAGCITSGSTPRQQKPAARQKNALPEGLPERLQNGGAKALRCFGRNASPPRACWGGTRKPSGLRSFRSAKIPA